MTDEVKLNMEKYEDKIDYLRKKVKELEVYRHKLSNLYNVKEDILENKDDGRQFESYSRYEFSVSTKTLKIILSDIECQIEGIKVIIDNFDPF